MKLSILMAAYNEAERLPRAIKQVLAVDYPCDVELVIVDDGSTDGTWAEMCAVDDLRVVSVRHERNRGKGAAIKTAAARATGDYMIIFDADLEYSPEDIVRLLHAVQQEDAHVVFGPRRFGSSTAHSFWYVIGNKVTTFTANAVFDCWIGDLHTCLKMMPLDLFRQLRLRQNGFGLDTELTGELLGRGIRPYEVPISYKARSHAQGKKISWKDGVHSLAILVEVRWRFRKHVVRPRAAES